MNSLKNYIHLVILFWITSLVLQSTLTKEDPLTFQEQQEINNKLSQFTRFINKYKQDVTFLSQVSQPPHQDSAICKTCIWFYNHIHDMLTKKYGVKCLLSILTSLCSLGMDKSVCNEYINLYGAIIYDSLLDHYLNGEYICSKVSICKSEHFISLKADDFARQILKDKPTGNTSREIDINAPTWKMLQVADIHVDNLYKEGSKATCASPLCCRGDTVYYSSGEVAGKWGYVGKCDIPFKTLEEFTRQVVEEVKPDFIIWTGDNPPHDPWTGSQGSAFNATLAFAHLLLNKYNYTLPVYPSIGNHELFPNDEYFPYDDSEQSVLSQYASIFKNWLGEEAYDTFSKFGYYSLLHPGTNLRIVSTNCLLCDSVNFNLIKNPTDPNKEVQWLENTLRTAEAGGEVVYLLRHIPIGDGFFLEECTKRFQAIINRFDHVILGQFYGHTHNDEVKVVHNYFNYTEISSVGFIAPSLTTYGSLNPSFRVYEIDSNTKVPKDYLQYRLNLTEANELDQPRWEEIYRASELFNVTFLNDTNGIFQYTLDIEKSSDTFDKALSAYFAGGPNYEEYKTVENMPHYLSCRFRETTFMEFFKCVNYRTLFYDEYLYVLLNKLSGEWYEKLEN